MVQDWTPLLIQLWREQHPEAHEQLQLDFTVPSMRPEPVPLFDNDKQAVEMPSYAKPGKGEAVATCPDCGAGTIVDDPGPPSLADPNKITMLMTVTCFKCGKVFQILTARLRRP